MDHLQKNTPLAIKYEDEKGIFLYLFPLLLRNRRHFVFWEYGFFVRFSPMRFLRVRAAHAGFSHVYHLKSQLARQVYILCARYSQHLTD